MSTLSEKSGVEIPVYKWLTDLGWEGKTPDDLKIYNRPLSNPIIDDIFLNKISELNNITLEEAKSVYNIFIAHFRNPNQIVANELILDLLCKGVNITLNHVDRTIILIDFENINNNDLIATRQYWVHGNKVVKPDIVLLVNGIPLITIEAKQRAKKNVNWLDGVNQFKRYCDEAPKLFICNLFGVACNGMIAKYGIPGVSSSYFFEWKDLSLTQEALEIVQKNKNWEVRETAQMSYLEIPEYERMKQSICGLLQPARVLDILKNFIVFEQTQESGVIKKVARYQQVRAANKILVRVINTLNGTAEDKQGIIWHTQGSGKSLTMLYTAYKLRNHPDLKDPAVYIVVDRKDLRTQIGGTFDDCDFPNTFKPMNINQLKQKITDKASEVIITTVQKFSDLGEIEDNRDNVIVLIDEAHRTEYGDYQSELKKVFPNAFRFAFTGTPILKTHQEFGADRGDKVEIFLDKYGIQDSIEDGATVEIRYSAGIAKYQLDREKLKKGYEEITEDLNEEQKRAVERKVKPWKEMIKKPERIQIIAENIANDFKEQVAPNGFKAQVVAVDKETCVMYYKELRKYFNENELAIVFSKNQNEPEERHNLFRDFYLEDGELKKLIKRFKKRITEEEIKKGNNLKILIVCNMLLTGFDAPIEQTMYLDSPLRNHNLLQAIARTNRPYDIEDVSKQFGRVVDYVGVFQDLNEALQYDPKEIESIRNIDELIKTFPDIMAKAFEPFNEIKLEDSYECTIAIVRTLGEIDQTEFEKNFRNVVQFYEAISPNAFLVQYRNQYKWLITIYEIYLSEYKRLGFDAEFYAQKTKELLKDSIKVLDFKKYIPEVKIDKDYIDNLAGTNLSPDDKAEKIIRDIETVIKINEQTNPIYVELYKRLEELIKQKREKSKAIEDVLTELEKLYKDLDEVESLPKRLGFEDKGSFSIYQEIKNAIPDFKDDNLIKQFAIELTDRICGKRYYGWSESDKADRFIELEIELTAYKDEFAEINIIDNHNLVENIKARIIQHYSL